MAFPAVLAASWPSLPVTDMGTEPVRRRTRGVRAVAPGELIGSPPLPVAPERAAGFPPTALSRTTTATMTRTPATAMETQSRMRLRDWVVDGDCGLWPLADGSGACWMVSDG